MPKAARLTDTGSGHDCFPPSPVTSGSPDVIINGQPAARKGDTLAPHGCTCGGGHGVHPRTIAAGSSSVLINGKPAARIGDCVDCGGVVSTGSGNVIIGDTPYKSPVHDCALQAVINGAPLLALSPMLTVTPVFAKSCLRAEGCTDAGKEAEPHDNFPPMAFYRVVPAPQPEPEQHAQAAKKPQASSTEPVQRAQSAKKPAQTTARAPEPPAAPGAKAPEEKPWYKTLFSSEPAAPEPKPDPVKPAEAPAEASAAGMTAGASLAWLFGTAPAPGSWSLRVAAAVQSAMTAAAEAGTAAAAAGGRALATGAELAGPVSRVLASGPGAPLAALAVGMFPGKLNDGEQDFIDKMRLQQLAEQQGTAPTRVRFQWEKQADGRLMPVGYHTEMGSGYDQVPVRMMELNTASGYYEFTTDGPRPVTILWTPDNPGVVLPHHTGNEDPVTLPPHITVLPIPKNTGGHIESYPAPEERSFRDYILVLPIPDIPPIYIYLSAPPVGPLEVGDYNDLAKRSVKDGMDIDHIPSQGALKLHLQKRYGDDITDDEIKDILKQGVAIATPTRVHRKYSETYGGKNNSEKKELDASDIRTAVDSNVDAQVPGWLEEGYSEEQISEARADLHRQNEAKGFYEPWE